jgi:hypothetical protein
MLSVSHGPKRRVAVVAVVAVVVVFARIGGVGRAAVAHTVDGGLTVGVSGPAHVSVNDHYSYTVTVANRRTDGVAALGVAVVASYYTTPLEYWSGVAGAKCTGLGNGQASCLVGDVPAGSARTFTITLIASKAGRDSRTFVATAGDPAMTATGTYTATVVALPRPPTAPAIVPSLTLRRTESTMTFTLTLTNKGPGAMNEITVTDRYDYPALEVTPNPTCTPRPYYVDCKIKHLAQGASTTLRYVARVMAPKAHAPAQYRDGIIVSFPWHTNTSGFQENAYNLLTKPTTGR